jgi:glyoxylase I family protein
MQVTALHHVSVNVSDVSAAESFYVGVLGLAKRTDRPDFPFGGAWLDAGGQQIHLIEAAPPPDQGQHLALLVDDLDDAVAELRARGVEVSGISPVGAARQAFLHDPSGNRIELQQRSR